MRELNPEYTGFMFGALMAFFHAIWALLVLFGYAQGLLDWVFSLQFLNNPFRMATFGFTQALMLVTFTFAVWYVVGWIFAYLWNLLHVAEHSSRKSK